MSSFCLQFFQTHEHRGRGDPAVVLSILSCVGYFTRHRMCRHAETRPRVTEMLRRIAVRVDVNENNEKIDGTRTPLPQLLLLQVGSSSPAQIRLRAHTHRSVVKFLKTPDLCSSSRAHILAPAKWSSSIAKRFFCLRRGEYYGYVYAEKGILTCGFASRYFFARETSV